MTMEQGYVQVYTGDGKGKTTAAVGLAMRAAAANLRVCFCQFMKCGPTGELDAFPACLAISLRANSSERATS